MYGEFPVASAETIFDFEIDIHKPKSVVRRMFMSQCYFSIGGESPFAPMKAHQAYGLFEWAFNWCISTYCHDYLVIHAAVLEKNGICIILPAPPGSGKSTLTALLSYSGWRLLSDELTLIDYSTGEICPLARPINLKNQSIPVIKQEFPDVTCSHVMADTHKGDVCLFKASTNAIINHQVNARATHVIFPKYQADSAIQATSLEEPSVLFALIENAFNYNMLGEQGFDAMTDLVGHVEGLQFTYGNNHQAIAWFEALANG